jgi:hypothetical protein
MIIPFSNNLKKLVWWARVAFFTFAFAFLLALLLLFDLGDQETPAFVEQHAIIIYIINFALLGYGIIASYLIFASSHALIAMKWIDESLRRRALVRIWIVPFVSVVLFLGFGLIFYGKSEITNSSVDNE